MTTYKDAGVDIDVANEGLKRIKKHFLLKNIFPGLLFFRSTF